MISTLKNHPVIKNMLEEAQTRWQQFSLRERMLVAVGSILIVLAAFDTLFWEPLSTAVSFYRNEVVTNQSLLLQLDHIGPEIKQLRGKVKPSQIKNQSELLSVIEKEVRKSPLQAGISEIGLGTENSVKLQFHDVSFDDLIVWLIDLQQKEGIVVKLFSVEKLEEAGHVRALVNVIPA